MLTIFCGYDAREAVGFHTFCQSVIERSTIPVQLVPLGGSGMMQGSNEFTYSRFLVPYLMNYKGRAVFADASDMLCLGDVKELLTMLNMLDTAVGVVKHEYETVNPIKYIGTELECKNYDYPRKNWASLMLIDCEHPSWRIIEPDTLSGFSNLELLKLRFIPNDQITEIDDAWNRLVDEGQSLDGAKLIHWTAGIPAFEHYKNAVGADLWRQAWSSVKYPLAT